MTGSFFIFKCHSVQVLCIVDKIINKTIIRRKLKTQKWPLVENVSPIICGRTPLVPTPAVPDANAENLFSPIN